MNDDKQPSGKRQEEKKPGPLKKEMRLWQKILLLVLTVLGIWTAFTNREIVIDNLAIRNYAITSVPTLDIQTDTSTIIISTWAQKDKIDLEGFTSSSGWVAPEVKTTITQQGNLLRVVEHVQPFLSLPGGSGNITLFIDVPVATTVIIHMQMGQVDLTGVSGRYDIHTAKAGVHIGSGMLSGSSEVETTSGTIDFHGSFNPQSRDRFKSQQGAITLTLPANAAFDLQATSYHTPLHNDFGSNHVGLVPRAQVKVETHGGNISVFRGT